jgi:RNA polymerase sigma factor (sigma-70 family)
MHHHDQRYIDALINNNQQLLEEVYKKFSGKIKWMVLQNNGTETDAADIFQDALLCVYRRAVKGNFVLTCPFEAFLYRICKNAWLKELVKRRQGRVTINEQGEYMLNDRELKLIDETEMMQARRNLISGKLNELDEHCRQLLTMSWSGKPMEEVAKAMNFSYGYARKKKNHCMAKLIFLIKESSTYNSLKW